MRTARTEVGHTRSDVFGVVGTTRGIQRFHTRLDAIGGAAFLDKDTAQLFGNPDRVQCATGGEQLFAMLHPGTTAFVPAIDAAMRIREQRLFDLHLDQLALLFHDDHQIEPFGPLMEPLHVQREGLPDLIERDPQTFGFVLVDVKQAHGVDHIQPVLAGCRDADLGPALAPHAFVHLVGVAKRLCGKALIVDHPRFLQMRRVLQTNVQPAVGHIELRGDQLHSVRVTIHDRCRLYGVFHRLEADPQPAETA